jgi:RHS repeat-associated protein
MVTDSTQTVTATQVYDAFGDQIGGTGSTASALQWQGDNLYATYAADAGLILAGSRYYDPQVGRFITRDTDISQHPYIYCNGDPVNHSDASGHQTLDISKFIKAAVPASDAGWWGPGFGLGSGIWGGYGTLYGFYNPPEPWDGWGNAQQIGAGGLSAWGGLGIAAYGSGLIDAGLATDGLITAAAGVGVGTLGMGLIVLGIGGAVYFGGRWGGLW